MSNYGRLLAGTHGRLVLSAGQALHNPSANPCCVSGVCSNCTSPPYIIHAVCSGISCGVPDYCSCRGSPNGTFALTWYQACWWSSYWYGITCYEGTQYGYYLHALRYSAYMWRLYYGWYIDYGTMLIGSGATGSTDCCAGTTVDLSSFRTPCCTTFNSPGGQIEIVC
jgi:hypothetical protein